MFISFKNKRGEVVKISQQNIKEIIHLENTYVRFFYSDGSEINISYNSNSVSFRVDHEALPAEINNIIQDLILIP